MVCVLTLVVLLLLVLVHKIFLFLLYVFVYEPYERLYMSLVAIQRTAHVFLTWWCAMKMFPFSSNDFNESSWTSCIGTV